MEMLELNQQKCVEDYLKINRCQIIESLALGNTRKSKDLFLTIERVINSKILFFEIPAIKYTSVATIFKYDIVSDIYTKITQK